MMIQRRNPTQPLVSALVLLCWLTFASSASAVSFTLVPATTTVLPGQSVGLTLLASDPSPDVIGGFDLDLAFDSAVLSVASYSPTTALGDLMFGQAFDVSGGASGSGMFNVTIVSTLDSASLSLLQQGQFALATFSVLIDPSAFGGTTALSLSLNALSDGSGLPLATTSLGGASLTVIPEPSTGVLLCMGLVGLVRNGSKRSPVRRAPQRVPHGRG